MILGVIMLIAVVNALLVFTQTQSTIFHITPAQRKKITNIGWWILSSLAASIVLPVALYCLQQKDQEAQTMALRKGYDSSLVLNRKEVIAAIGDTLNKIGLSLSVTDKNTVVISKTITGDDPVLKLSDDPDTPSIQVLEINNGNAHFKLNIKSADAGSSFFEIKSSVILINPDLTEPKYLFEFSPLEYRYQISKNKIVDKHFLVNHLSGYYSFCIWTRGNYKSIDGLKHFTMDEMVFCNLKDKSLQDVGGITKQRIIAFVNDNEK